jgi:hypothetical protein
MLASIELITPIVGILASLIAALSSAVFSKIARSKEEPGRIAVANSAAPPLSEDEEREIDTRLVDARDELARQISSAKWNGRSAISLAISQYVVGGTLATSFIQNNLPEEAVGFLGLVVLLASIIYQRFRPDLRTGAARRRVALLRATIRRAEDGLYGLRKSLPQAPSLEEIRADVTNALIQIEHSELEDNFLPLPTPPHGDQKKD